MSVVGSSVNEIRPRIIHMSAIRHALRTVQYRRLTGVGSFQRKDANGGVVLQEGTSLPMQQWRGPRAFSNRYEPWDTDSGFHQVNYPRIIDRRETGRTDGQLIKLPACLALLNPFSFRSDEARVRNANTQHVHRPSSVPSPP